MKKQYQIIAFSVLFLLLGLILFKKPAQVFPASNSKTIVNNIDNSFDTIIELNNGIQDEKRIINAFNLKLASLYDSLDRFKQIRDTFQIIQAQDTIIQYLVSQGASKDSVILLQQGIISQYEFITKSKDTLIAVKDFDLKRIKRQRNIAFIGAGVMTGIAIFK
jgi:hypothetical protein